MRSARVLFATLTVAAVTVPSTLALASPRPGVRHVPARGGRVRLVAASRHARSCTWHSIPRIPGFDATVHCGRVVAVRTAVLAPNLRLVHRAYAVELVERGASTTVVRWELDEGAIPRATTSTTTRPTTVAVAPTTSEPTTSTTATPTAVGPVAPAQLVSPGGGSSGAPPATSTASTSTTTAPSLPTGSDGPVTAGDSKTDCIYVPLGTALSDAETATGVTFNCISAYATGTSDWAEWEDPWVAQDSGYGSWLAADPGQRTLVLALDLVPGSEDTNADWRGQCAQGQFTSDATVLGESLVTAGLGDAVVRLAPEMDGSWVADNIGITVAEWRNWAVCFQKTAAAMKAVAGAHFLFDWNVAACGDDAPLADYFPVGGEDVDIIGVDQYDVGCPSPAPPASTATFDAVAADPEGLDAVGAFAEAQGKPMSIPEWATSATDGSPAGLGDDGYYVAGIGAYVAEHDVAFQSWYDSGDKGVLQLSSANPISLQAYIDDFG